MSRESLTSLFRNPRLPMPHMHAADDYLPREIQLHVLYQLCNFRDLRNLLLASSSFYRVYKANIARVVSAITINVCRKRGIHLTHLNKLTVAYLEFWAMPPSLDLENAFRELLCREPQKALILSISHCTALRALGGFRAWSLGIGVNYERVLKPISQECDVVRIKKRRGYIHTEYGLLCCGEVGPVSRFENLKAEHVRAMFPKARLRGVTAIGLDEFGQEYDSKHDQDAILWAGRRCSSLHEESRALDSTYASSAAAFAESALHSLLAFFSLTCIQGSTNC